MKAQTKKSEQEIQNGTRGMVTTRLMKNKIQDGMAMGHNSEPVKRHVWELNRINS
jgi:hypothetical protein